MKLITKDGTFEYVHEESLCSSCAFYEQCNHDKDVYAADGCRLLSINEYGDDIGYWKKVATLDEEVATKELKVVSSEERNRLRPNYYLLPNGIECKDVIGEMSYNIGAAVKYLWRHGRKTEQGIADRDKAIEDLKKAIEHIKFEIDKLEK